MSIWKLIIIFLPFLFCFVIASVQIASYMRRKNKITNIINRNILSLSEKNILHMVEENEERKLSYLESIQAQLNLFGIEYKLEFFIGVTIVAVILVMIASLFFFRAGPLLLLYLGAVTIFIVIQIIEGMIKKRRNALTIEFLERLRDLSSYLSAGKSVASALGDVVENAQISDVMYRELNLVRTDISMGKPMSTSFASMYKRLGIREIKIFSQTLAVYEDNGGNLVNVMQAIDRSFAERLAIKNQQRVLITSMKNTRKFTIGIPVCMMLGLAIINPTFFGSFYTGLMGQIAGIVMVTMLLIGVFVSNHIAEL